MPKGVKIVDLCDMTGGSLRDALTGDGRAVLALDTGSRAPTRYGLDGICPSTCIQADSNLPDADIDLLRAGLL